MNKKILVVDDNPVMLKLMTNLLEKEGHEVYTARDGYTALNALVSYIPDIIFVDLFMPNIGGDKLCHIIRKMPHLQGAFLIIISAAFSELDIEFENLVADYFIAKGPYHEMADDILTAIEISDYPDRAEAISKLGVPVKKYTPRRLAQELILQRNDLEKMLESIDDGILEIFAGKIIYANEAAISFLGYSEEELLGKDFLDLFESKDRTRIKPILTMTSGKLEKIPQENITTINHRQLSIKHFFKKGSASNSVIILTDMTRQNLKAYQERHARRMELGAILSRKTHRLFQKQIDAIQESIDDILNAKIFDDASGSDHLEKMNRHLREMSLTCHQLHLLSGLNKGNALKIDAPLQAGKETILIADHDVLVCEFNKLMLKDLRYGVITSKKRK